MDSDDEEEAEEALFVLAAATVVTSAMLAVVEGSKRRRVIPRIQDFWLRRVPLFDDKAFLSEFRIPRAVFFLAPRRAGAVTSAPARFSS